MPLPTRKSVPGPPTTTTENPRSVDELEHVRKEVQERNSMIAKGEYSKSAGKHFEHIYVVQVHSRREFLSYLLTTLKTAIEHEAGSHLLVLLWVKT
jgi:hypothetical protein